MNERMKVLNSLFERTQFNLLSVRTQFNEEIENRRVLDSLLFNNSGLIDQFWRVLAILLWAISNHKKILIFGNGGSAAEAQHFAAELVCKFEKNRNPIAAIALTTDSSILTAQSNDLGFDSVFERQVEALCRPGDVVVGLTTSDITEFADGSHSRNILGAFRAAQREKGIRIGFFSQRTVKLLEFVDVAIIVPHTNTALIQEVHLSLIHMLCKQIEQAL